MFTSRKKTNGFFSRAFRRLNARSSGAATLSDRNRAIIHFSLTVVLLVAILLLLRALLRLYFFGGNVFGLAIPEQKVDRVEISAGEAVPRKLLLEYLQIREGMPFFDPKEGLFARDLGRRQKKVLEAAPALATLSVSRTSSNVVSVIATERAPLAKFDSLPFAIDKESVVFARYRGIEQLPVITGFAKKALTPGLRITSHRMMAATLELLQCLEAGQSELRKGFLVSVDVSKVDYLTCEMTDGRHVKFAWKEMGRGTEKGRKWLIAQLDGYVATIQDPRSRNCKEFDFRVPGHGYGR
jgi:hypothetical protein